MKRILLILFIGLNLLVTAGLLFTAYSPYIDGEHFPMLASTGLFFPIFLVLSGGFLLFWLIFYRRYMLISFISLLCCAPQIRTYIPFNIKSEPPKEAIKVLSYNVMHFHYLQMTKNGNPILNYLQRSDADIICLQEYSFTFNHGSVTPDVIFHSLAAYPYNHVQIFGGTRLACFSKYPILSAKPLPYESRTNGSMEYEIAIGKDTMTLINNHLESNRLSGKDKEAYNEILTSPKAKNVKEDGTILLKKLRRAQEQRAAQAKVVAQTVKASKHPYVIVCGDFNDSPISYAHRLIAKDLTDAFVSSGNGLGISYNQNNFFFRIDNILISKNLKAYQCTVDRSIRNSDHYPIWCYIAKK
jgi:endonuclease/exonuclease/phosphatase family metal-dependent hydrolase